MVTDKFGKGKSALEVAGKNDQRRLTSAATAPSASVRSVFSVAIHQSLRLVLLLLAGVLFSWPSSLRAAIAWPPLAPGSQPPTVINLLTTATNQTQIFFRNRYNGTNHFWQMTSVPPPTNQTSQPASTTITNQPDPSWKMIGLGDFGSFVGGVAVTNLDGKMDIVWQHEATSQKAVWFMNGTNFLGSTMLMPDADPDWRVVAVADFNGDGNGDLLWRSRSSGQLAIWFMQGTNFWRGGGVNDGITGSTMPVSASMKIRAVGNFDNNGYPDLMWQHDNGALAIWNLRNGVDFSDGSYVLQTNLIKNTSGGVLFQYDPDWQAVLASDFDATHNPPTSTDRTDLLWRYVSTGQNVVWPMINNVYQGFVYNLYPEPDTAWRAAAQDLGDSTWRQTNTSNVLAAVSATVNAAAPSITLNFQLPDVPGYFITIARRTLSPLGAWVLRMSNSNVTSFVDDNTDTHGPTVGTLYEYDISRDCSLGGVVPGGNCNNGGPAPLSNAYHYKLISGINVHTQTATGTSENRGRILLLVDSAVAGSLGAELHQLDLDLIADGWTVSRQTLNLRHDDSSNGWPNNVSGIAQIKGIITNSYNANTNTSIPTKAVYLIGHLPIPYSGIKADDGHNSGNCIDTNGNPIANCAHEGAWPADMYYGDVNGAWQDNATDYLAAAWEANRNHANDGKFTNDFCPSNLELMVGRIDFWNMTFFVPSVGADPLAAEINLLKRYFAKVHKYRNLLLSNAPRQRGMAYGIVRIPPPPAPQGFPQDFIEPRNFHIFSTAMRNLSAFYGSNPGNAAIGDPFNQYFDSYLWGFYGGGSHQDVIAENAGVPVAFLQYATTNYSGGQEPLVGFYGMLGSYFGDWNYANNFMRATLTGPNFGFAAFSTFHARWRFEAMAMGDVLGTGLLRMVNDPFPDSDPNFPNNDRRRQLAIMGDPTLRLHVLKPPQNFTGTSSGNLMNLSWTFNRGNRYSVYRANNGAFSPFTRVATLLSTNSFQDNGFFNNTVVYMIRAATLQTSGSGSYTNFSEGVFFPPQ